jgi:hypothetical protein
MAHPACQASLFCLLGLLHVSWLFHLSLIGAETYSGTVG